jgi:hydroxymethylglutaryl-CoA lyase
MSTLHSSSASPGASVRIYEVSPRDGLQNEPTLVSTDDKVALIQALVEAGLQDIEVTSFVRPSWIPQLADAAELISRLPVAEGVRYWALVPNSRGLERAMETGIRDVATFMSASETHNQKNLNRTRQESLAAQDEVIRLAKADGMRVRAYISTVFGCPYEGEVSIRSTRELCLALLGAGADEVALGDTTGMGNPRLVRAVIDDLRAAGVPVSQIGLHMHDTRGTALANIYAGFEAGVRTFDGSVAGVGGCPYAPGASGNAATDDVVHLFEAMGVSTGVDLGALAEAGVALGAALGRELSGRYHLYHKGQRSRPARAARSA